MAQARTEELADGSLAMDFARCGCRELVFGIETAGTPAAKTNRKSRDPHNVRQAVTSCRDAGIRTRGNFMLGFPEDTVDTVRETVRHAASLGLHSAEFMFVAPYPGSALSLSSDTPQVDWLGFSPSRPVCLSPSLDEHTLQLLYRYAKSAVVVSGIRRRARMESLPLREVASFWREFVTGPQFSRRTFLKWQARALSDGLAAVRS